MGSRTTYVVANKLKKVSIGVDINPDYIKTAKTRIEELVREII